jgi:uncharacterized protein (DUF488 family)
MAVTHCSRTGFSRKSHLYTIGHSTLPLAAFLKLLTCASSRVTIIDVRSVPRSRRPWFTQDRLRTALCEHGHTYEWLPLLGGRQSIDFAAYARTKPFARGLSTLLEIGSKSTRATVILCAESDPTQCHRWLIAGALTARGKTVAHILTTGTLLSHTQGERS